MCQPALMGMNNNRINHSCDFEQQLKRLFFPVHSHPLLSALNCSSVTDCYWYGWSGWLCSFPSIDNRGALYRWMDDGRGDGSCRLSCDALWVILLDKHIPPPSHASLHLYWTMPSNQLPVYWAYLMGVCICREVLSSAYLFRGDGSKQFNRGGNNNNNFN